MANRLELRVTTARTWEEREEMIYLMSGPADRHDGLYLYGYEGSSKERESLPDDAQVKVLDRSGGWSRPFGRLLKTQE